MKGHAGAVLTSGLSAVALALALLQAVVIFHSARKPAGASASRAQTNRYSVPGGRSGVPWLPFDKAPGPATPPEGRTPEKQQEPQRAPPPPRQRALPPPAGPHPPRRAVA